MDPTTVEQTRKTVAETIESLIRLRTGGMIRDLRVEIAEDTVIVSGRTASYYNKQLATHGARAAIGDRQLRNEIEIC